MTRSAVIVRAGKRSMHGQWMDGGKPAFDLILVPYEDLGPALLERSTETITIPGNKVAGWARLFSSRPDLLDRYDQIAFLDDDLVASANDINRAFAIGREFKLSLWQPSLSWKSYFSYAVFLRNPIFRLRFVNFIEMMCPFFATGHLRTSIPLFTVGFETGIDRLWCRLHPTPYKAYAVLDEVTFHHTRPVGRNRSAQGFVGADGDYQTVIDRMEAVIDLPFRGPVAYAGVMRSGREIDGRIAIAALSAVPFLGWRKAVNTGWFLRPISDHIRHNLTRPIGNEHVSLEPILHRLRGRADARAAAAADN